MGIIAKMVRWSKFCFVGLVLAQTAPLLASETVTYSYDALGRLVTTTRSGGPANGVNAQTQYDPAGNRTNVAVTGATTSTPPASGGIYVVLPLNGYTIIKVGN